MLFHARNICNMFPIALQFLVHSKAEGELQGDNDRINRYLPGILKAFQKSVKHQYLLLSSLKEVIVCHANTDGLDFTLYVDQVSGIR